MSMLCTYFVRKNYNLNKSDLMIQSNNVYHNIKQKCHEFKISNAKKTLFLILQLRMIMSNMIYMHI